MQKKMSLTLESLMKQEWIVDSMSVRPLEVPFKLVAGDFLNFAKEDFKEDNLHGDVNAVTNIKRCIENRLDIVLFLFGYHEIAEKEKWSFPKKLRLLEKLGIKAPPILHKKINLKRVMVEHRYEYPPKHQDISDLIDISELFLKATDNFIKRTVSSLDCVIEKKELIQVYLGMELEIGKGKIKVTIHGPDKKMRRRGYGDLEKKLSLGIDDSNYCGWIRLYNELAY